MPTHPIQLGYSPRIIMLVTTTSAGVVKEIGAISEASSNENALNSAKSTPPSRQPVMRTGLHHPGVISAPPVMYAVRKSSPVATHPVRHTRVLIFFLSRGFCLVILTRQILYTASTTQPMSTSAIASLCIRILLPFNCKGSNDLFMPSIIVTNTSINVNTSFWLKESVSV